MGYGNANGWPRENVQCPHQSLRFEVPDFDMAVLAATEDSSVSGDETENTSVTTSESMPKEQAIFDTLPDLMERVQCKVIEIRDRLRTFTSSSPLPVNRNISSSRCPRSPLYKWEGESAIQ